MTVQRIGKPQQIAYHVAIQSLAAWVVDSLDARRVPAEEYLEAALAEVRRVEAAGRSEHLWVFRDPAAFALSENVFSALEEAPDGTRDWLHADTSSAVAAVARFDVIAAVSEMAWEREDSEADEDDDEGLPAGGVGRA